MSVEGSGTVDWAGSALGAVALGWRWHGNGF
jgi:hypothetical protein